MQGRFKAFGLPLRFYPSRLKSNQKKIVSPKIYSYNIWPGAQNRKANVKQNKIQLKIKECFYYV